jgi:hypothetical protein
MRNAILMLCGLLGLASVFTASSSAAQPVGYFSSPKLVPGIPLLGQFDFGQTVTGDGLLMIFNSNGTLYQARRGSTREPFSNATPLGTNVNTAAFEQTAAALTPDGLVLVFQRDPPGPTPTDSPEMDLFEARRASVDEPFGAVTPMPPAIDSYSAFTPWISPNGLMLLFSSTRPGGKGREDIWVATRSSLSEPFGTPVNFDDFFPGSHVNTAYEENGPCLSSDGLAVFVADLYDSRPGSHGGPDVWMAIRPNPQAPFGPLVNLNDVGLGSTLNGSSWDGFVFVSRDWPGPGSKLYFSSNRRTGTFDFDYCESEWVPSRWFQVAANPATAPPARAFHSMVYDTVRGVTLVHGGVAEPGTPSKTDTWAWDGTTWTLLTQQGPAEFGAGFAFDSDRGVAVLHGGFGSPPWPGGTRPTLGDTWEWNGQTWVQITTNLGPGMRAGSAMAYDPQHKRVLLHGGVRDLTGNTILSDTWAWDGSSWQAITNANGPLRVQHQMVYDAKRQVMVLFGGFGPVGMGPVDTWEFDGTQWHQVATNGPPGARQFPLLAYDPMRETVILYGGGQYYPYGGPTDKYFDDVWQWNGSAWSEITPPGTQPPAVQAGAGAFDSRRGRLVRLGGTTDYRNPILSRETWEYGLPELRLTGIERLSDGNFVIQWTGGAPPYQLQSCSNLFQGDWQNLGVPTDQTSATNPPAGKVNFFQVLWGNAP